MKKVQKKQPKKLLKNRCTFYYNHLDVNQKQDKDSKKNNNKKDQEDDEKDYYKKICKNHLEKKGKKKYWSNISRYGDNDNNLI